jgi:hypothetical protein
MPYIINPEKQFSGREKHCIAYWEKIENCIRDRGGQASFDDLVQACEGYPRPGGAKAHVKFCIDKTHWLKLIPTMNHMLRINPDRPAQPRTPDNIKSWKKN